MINEFCLRVNFKDVSWIHIVLSKRELLYNLQTKILKRNKQRFKNNNRQIFEPKVLTV